MSQVEKTEAGKDWDHSSNEEFLDYYSKQALSESTLIRFTAVRDMVLRMIPAEKASSNLEVADIGCGPGTQSILFAEQGHSVHGLDVNEPVLQLAQKRTEEKDLTIDFQLGSATDLPWQDESMDVVVLPELLEHVANWESCLNEATRILKPGGALYLSTTNSLCPKQQEFTLPLYSWYPGFVKRYCEKLAVTTRPEIANFAKYPAVNWFTSYGLKAALYKRGLKTAFDRFDCMDVSTRAPITKLAVRMIQAIPPLRLVGHILTPYTSLVAIKDTKT